MPLTRGWMDECHTLIDGWMNDWMGATHHGWMDTTHPSIQWMNGKILLLHISSVLFVYVSFMINNNIDISFGMNINIIDINIIIVVII